MEKYKGRAVKKGEAKHENEGEKSQKKKVKEVWHV